MAWLSTRFHKENSGRITYLTKVRFFHERYCTRVTLKNNKWWSLLTEFFSSQPANWYPSLILFDEYWVGQVKLNLEFRKLQTSLHTQIKFIWSLWRENPLSRKKMFEFFLFLNGNDTFWPSWRVHMIILFFLTCTGGTGKWKQFDSVGKFFLLYFLRFISLAVQHSPGTRLKTVHRWRVCRKILLRCELIILQNGHHCSVHRRKVCRNLLQLMNLSCELIE